MSSVVFTRNGLGGCGGSFGGKIEWNDGIVLGLIEVVLDFLWCPYSLA